MVLDCVGSMPRSGPNCFVSGAVCFRSRSLPSLVPGEPESTHLPPQAASARKRAPETSQLWPTKRTRSMADKSEKMKARLPRGLAARGADDIRAVEKMMATIRGVYELYGFEPVDQPMIEYTDALGKFLPDQDRPNEGVFSFQDDDDQWLSLRYDLTAPLARHVAANYGKQPKPYFRRYQVGPVWRNEKPGPGRFRQFTQFDADIVGSSSMAADAELCMLAADTLEKLGVKRGGYIVKFANSRASYNIKVGSRKVLDGVLETIGLGSHAQAGKRLAVLRAIDKLDR